MIDNWRTIKLEEGLDCLIDYRGKSPPKSQIGIPVISAKCVKNGRIVEPIEQTIEPSFYPIWMVRGYPLAGDIVMTTEGPLGEVAQLDEHSVKFALAQRVVCMRGQRGVLDNTFLKFLLMSPIQQAILSSYATGTTVAGISQKSLRSVPISIPPYNEQVAIGELLGALDEKIELIRRMNDTLETMARGIFKDWFLDLGPTRAKMESRAAYLAPEIWTLFPDQLDERGSPLGWELAKLGSICARVAMGPFGSDITTDNFVDQGVPVIRGGNLKSGFIDHKFVYLTNEKADALKNANAFAQDIIVTHRGTLGQVGIIPKRPAHARYVVSQSQMLLAADVEKATPRFIFEFLRSEHGLQQLLAHTSTVGVPAIARPTTSLKSLSIVMPPMEVLSVFDDLLDPLVEREAINISEAHSLAATRDLLLPRLMSGEIRVKQAEKIAETAL